MAHADKLPVVVIDELKKKFNLHDEQLDVPLKDIGSDLFQLAQCFDTVEIFAEQLGLSKAQLGDVKNKTDINGIQAGMNLALTTWVKSNPFKADLRALLRVVISRERADIALEICQHFAQKSIAVDRGLNKLASEYLGSGYDVCGYYADGNSIKRRIFDLSLINKKDIREIESTSSDHVSVTGNSYREYQESLSQKANLSGSKMLFSRAVERSFDSDALSFPDITTFVSTMLLMKYKTWKLHVSSKDFIYQQVIDDFNKEDDGKRLIEQYGAAVVMGMDIGGRWTDSVTVTRLLDSTSTVAKSLDAAYGRFVTGSSSSEISDCIKRNHESITSRKVVVVGGDPLYASEQNIEKWKASIRMNPAFINFTEDGLVWIWDVFPEHSLKLKKGFDDYLKEKEIKVEKKRLGIRCERKDGLKYATDARSGARKNIVLYKPPTDPTYKYVGVNGNDSQVMVITDLSPGHGAIQKPKEWYEVWNDSKSWNRLHYSCWMPVGPSDFHALGVYCRFGVRDRGPPTDEETEGLVVVHKSFLEEAKLTKADEVWSDAGTWAHDNLTLSRLPHKALWPTKATKAGPFSVRTIKPDFIV